MPEVAENWSLQDALQGVSGISSPRDQITKYDSKRSMAIQAHVTFTDYRLIPKQPTTQIVRLGTRATRIIIIQLHHLHPCVLIRRTMPPLCRPSRQSLVLPRSNGPLCRLSNYRLWRSQARPHQRCLLNLSLQLLRRHAKVSHVARIRIIHANILIATNERGEPLRQLNIPADLEKKFVQIAQSNIEKNIETCGVLCGKLVRNGQL